MKTKSKTEQVIDLFEDYKSRGERLTYPMACDSVGCARDTVANARRVMRAASGVTKEEPKGLRGLALIEAAEARGEKLTITRAAQIIGCASQTISGAKSQRDAPTLTQTLLKSLLHYNQKTGVFTWLERGGTGAGFSGKKAGSAHNPTGYWRIYVLGKHFQAHRLAWIYIYGADPGDDIDHKNRKRDDNRIENLRRANGKKSLSMTIRATSKSGFSGV